MRQLKAYIDQSGNDMHAYQLVLIAVVLSIIGGVLAYLFTHSGILALLAMAALPLLPFAKIRSDRTKRLARFEELGRGTVDWPAYLTVPYYVTTSIHETLWYNRMTPGEQGIDVEHLDRYVKRYGSSPPEREAAFAGALAEAGLDVRLIWSEGGHGWTDPVRNRVFEFFAGFERTEQP